MIPSNPSPCPRAGRVAGPLLAGLLVALAALVVLMSFFLLGEDEGAPASALVRGARVELLAFPPAAAPVIGSLLRIGRAPTTSPGVPAPWRSPPPTSRGSSSSRGCGVATTSWT